MAKMRTAGRRELAARHAPMGGGPEACVPCVRPPNRTGKRGFLGPRRRAMIPLEAWALFVVFVGAALFLAVQLHREEEE